MLTLCQAIRRVIKPQVWMKTYSAEAQISLENVYKFYKLDTEVNSTVTLTKEDAKYLLRNLLAIRRIENSADAMYKAKLIRGFCHLYSGEEAIAVGIKAAMRPADAVITAYRCHGWGYMMGISATGILAELTGRKDGIMRGKGGSMHIYTPKFFGGNGIVGAHVPVGTGVALAYKWRKKDAVCVICYGDGAANQGQVFEAYNIGCLLKVPAIYVCENNQYGMGTKNKRAACNTKYYTRGQYIPGIWVDGMNVLAVRAAAEYAIDFVLKNGPIVMEMSTYRYSGHSMSDPGISYRSRDEVREMREKRDPIANFKEVCLKSDILSEDDIKEISKDVKKEVDAAVKIAQSSPEVGLSELTADIYSKNLETKIRGPTGYTLQHPYIGKPINMK